MEEASRKGGLETQNLMGQIGNNLKSICEWKYERRNGGTCIGWGRGAEQMQSSRNDSRVKPEVTLRAGESGAALRQTW